MKNLIFSFAILLSFAPKSFAQTGQPINQILSAYYEVKNALVADDGKAASSKAESLAKLLNAMPMDKMTGPQHTVWMKYAGKLKSDAEHIGQTKNAGQQRDHFNNLSNNLFEVAKAFKGNEAEVYQQYCPMKKAYWLSENKSVKNPYYGKKMLTCGKVTATLPASK